MNDLSLIEAEFGDLSPWRESPDFWVATPQLGLPFIAALRSAGIHVIGRSAGGHEIIALDYGGHEPLDTGANNLHSALAARIYPADATDIFPPAFYGNTRRKKPVLVLQGGIHGGELAGTVASLNLCQIIETGRDLRGRGWPRLRELALKTRLVIIPWLNMDGCLRWPLPNSSGAPDDLVAACNHGVKRNGERYRYPDHKALWPIPPAETGFMGAYFNDNGVNLQYDCFSPQRQSETTAWMELYLREKPDGVLIWHGNAGSLIGPPSYYLPPGHQHEESRIAGAVQSRLQREGFRLRSLSWRGLPGLGKPLFTQMDAVYHVCGATPIMCEMPVGMQSQPFTCDEMLDIGLIVLEEVLNYAQTDGLRPYENWEKVRRTAA